MKKKKETNSVANKNKETNLVANKNKEDSPIYILPKNFLSNNTIDEESFLKKQENIFFKTKSIDSLNLRNLEKIYNRCLQREGKIIKQIKRVLVKNKKGINLQKEDNPSSKNIGSSEKNKDYAKDFNEILTNFSKGGLSDLAMLFRNETFLSSCVGSVTKIYSTALGSLIKEKRKTSNKDQFSNESRDSKTIFLQDFTNLLIKYNNGEIEFEKIQEFLEYIDEGFKIEEDKLKSSIEDVFDGEIFELNLSIKRTGGVTAETEKKVKKIFANLVRSSEGLNNNLTIKKTKLFEVYEKVTEQKDTYTRDVTVKINNLNHTKDNEKSEQVFKNFYNYIKGKINNLDSKWNKTDLEFQWEKNQTIVKNIIFGNIKNFKEGKDILSAYGYAQIKGLFGEIAAALDFSQKGANAKITGSERTKAGQKNYDISFSLNNQIEHKYGIQVKNYKGDSFNKVYETEFHLNKIAEINKYLGEKIGIAFLTLLGNNDILKYNKELYEINLYNFIDNFLRISAGDISETIKSDIFIFGNRYLPASYLIHLIYIEILNLISKKEKIKRSFELAKIKSIPENKKTEFDQKKDNKQNSNLLELEENLQIFKQASLYYKGISIKLKGLL